MGERVQAIRLLREASQEELFHLQNGLDITSVRELVVQLRLMDEETFSHHVTKVRNDFATWIRDVFHEDMLADEIARIKKKDELANHIEQRLIDLEERQLQRFGESLATADLQRVEETIERLRSEGLDETGIRDELRAQGVKENIVALLLIGKHNPYREYYDLKIIENISRFHEELNRLKRSIINAVVDGSTLIEIKEYLKRQGWHDDIIDFVIYDVFKPHPNIQKVARYIHYQLREKKKDIAWIKENLIALGWKEFIIDSIIYGINDPDNSLQKILSYLEESVKDEDQEKIKRFLIQLGWQELDINEAMRQRAFDEIGKRLHESFNIEGGSFLKEECTIINSHLILIDERGKELWKRFVGQTRKIALEKFTDDQGELHLGEPYTYYYAKSDIDLIAAREAKAIHTVQYLSQEKPLLVEHKERYLILPRIIERECVACKKVLPINHMREIILWDDARTHKVRKYVCEQHKNEVRSLIEDTRIVQS